MAVPVLTPSSAISRVVLSSSGDPTAVTSTLPYGIYSSSDFLSGAADQVSYVYKKLGGDVLDLEITNGNVYAAYEEAVLEYSYLVNIHQAKNSLGDLLGFSTASFDQDGEITGSGTDVSLKFPRYTFQYAQRVAAGLADESNAGGNLTVYSASLPVTGGIQDYDLQAIVSSSVAAGTTILDTGDTIGNRKITIRKVFYMTGRAMWRFFAFYGGLNVIGNLSTYGQYADDSTFEVIPSWQNKLQAIQYEDSIRTRISGYSYEIHNNKLRLYPRPLGLGDENYWFQFTIEKDPWEEYADRRSGADGINNMNTLPFANIPYNSINSIGKQWIRRFALSVSKEMLGQVRNKFGNAIPIPGETISLNGSDLISQGKEEQTALRDELKTVLDELTYAKLAEKDAATVENATKVLTNVALPIFIG